MKIVSLGMNCEVQFAMEYVLGKVESNLFSWVFIEDELLFLRLLHNLDDLFHNEHEYKENSIDMLIDSKYKIAYHTRYNLQNASKEEMKIAFEELMSRINHLKWKFESVLNSDEEVCFIKKMYFGNIINKATALKQIIYLYVIAYGTFFFLKYRKKKKFHLYVVLDERHYDIIPRFLLKGSVKFRKVDYFSPWDNTKNGLDKMSWKKIIDEVVSDL